MPKYIIFSILLLGNATVHAVSGIHPPAGMSLPEFWGEKHVWWHGRTNFKGEVIASACSLAMEDLYQTIDMGTYPVRDLQDGFAVPRKHFRVRLRNCDLVKTGKQRNYTVSHVRVTIDGLQGEKPDTFFLIGQAKGIYLQVLDSHGNTVKVGKVMSPLLLNRNEDMLDYSLQIVRSAQPLKAGDYYASLKFKVDYE